MPRRAAEAVRQIAVPNSSGTAPPRRPAPPGACDCHLHVYDPRFPMANPAFRGTANASAAEYRLLQQRIGTTRAVVVQPAAYGTDNRVTVAAIEQLGRDHARGIAVVHPEVSDHELEALHRGGIRGLRFTQHEPRTAVTTPAMIEPLAHRIAPLGWHVQLHLLGEQIAAMAELIRRLPGIVVFDHLGRLPLAEGSAHPAFRVIAEVIESGRGWVKLAGAYLNTQVGPPDYPDTTEIAREFVRLAPERCVWGSDWPHPTESAEKPDDAVLFDLLDLWAPDDATRGRILIENPAALYGW